MPGSIWFVVAMAKTDHRSMMKYRKEKMWSHADYCRSQVVTTMRAVRLIARGLSAQTEREIGGRIIKPNDEMRGRHFEQTPLEKGNAQ